MFGLWVTTSVFVPGAGEVATIARNAPRATVVLVRTDDQPAFVTSGVVDDVTTRVKHLQELAGRRAGLPPGRPNQEADNQDGEGRKHDAHVVSSLNTVTSTCSPRGSSRREYTATRYRNTIQSLGNA
jgi:hypothetical protein